MVVFEKRGDKIKDFVAVGRKLSEVVAAELTDDFCGCNLIVHLASAADEPRQKEE